MPKGTTSDLIDEVKVAGLVAKITQRADGLFMAYWRQAGKPKNTTSKTLEGVKELARRRMKDAVKGQRGRVMTIEDAELVELTKRLAGDRSPFAWLREVEDAQKRLKGVATLSQAVSHYQTTGMLQIERMGFVEARRAFLADYRPMGLESVASMRKALAGFENEHAGISVDEITAEILEPWLRKSRKGDAVISKATFNNRRGFWGTFLNHCREVLKCWPKHEKHAAEVIERVKTGNRIPEIFTPETVIAALKVLPATYLPTFIVGTWMGPRPESELRLIDWKHFDWKRGYLHITLEVARKTPRERFVPIPDNVRALLAPFVKAEGKISGRMHIQEMSKVLRLKGVIAKWPPDVMRHSSISYAIASGKSIGVVAEQHGNSESIIRKRYRRPLTAHDAKEWYSIGLTNKTRIEKIRG